MSGLIFDHFGDFEGFILETQLGEMERFRSREQRVMEIVRRALEDRNRVTVVLEPGRHDEVRSIVLQIAPPPHL